MGSSDRDREDLAAFLLRMRGGVPQPDRRIMNAVEEVPRRLFLPEEAGDVYADQCFPIPCGETAGSVRTAVRLLSALDVQPESRILEVGTGSGYVTALLARLGVRVTSLERYKTLLSEAAERLKHLGIANITLLLEDGRNGHAANAPYDRILIHGAMDELPRAILEQIAMGGRVVCALGPALAAQRLTLHQKVGSRFEPTELGEVRWQPLQRSVAAFL